MGKMNLKQLYKVGMVGLGVMGRNLLLSSNMEASSTANIEPHLNL
jgi:hypothetical protein